MAVGVDQLKTIVETLAEVLNVLSKVVNKQGLFPIFGLAGPLSKLANFDFDEIKQEVLDLDSAEGGALQTAFKAKLDLVNKDVQAKLLQSGSILQEAIDLVHEGVNLFDKAELLLERVKALVSSN